VDCSRYEELISLAVSGELTPEERRELSRHLELCEGCRQIRSREQRLWETLCRTRDIVRTVPPGVPERLAAAARNRASGHSRRPHRTVLAATSAAAAAALLLITLLVLRGRPAAAPIRVARVISGQLMARLADGWHETGEVWSEQLCQVPADPGAEVCLRLADGSLLRLERGVSFLVNRGVVPAAAGDRSVELLGGALTADVAGGQKRLFFVAAPGGRVTAKGTRFWVRAGPSDKSDEKEDGMNSRSLAGGVLATALAVAVFEGSVSVAVKGAVAAEPVVLQAGEETRPAASPAAAPQVTSRTVASAVPADALLFVSAAGRNRWLKAFDESTLGAAAREEQVKRFMQPVRENLDRLLAEHKTRLEENLGNALKFADIEAALQGEIGLAILGMGRPAAVKAADDAGPPPRDEAEVLFVAEVGEHAQAFETGMGDFIRNIQLLVDAKGGAHDQLTTRVYRGADLRAFRVGRHSIAYARTKGYFLLAIDPTTIEKGIDCLEGKAASLAETASDPSPAGRLLDLHADLGKWMTLERAKAPLDPKWRGLEAAGLAGVRKLRYSLWPEKPLFAERVTIDLAGYRGLLEPLARTRPVDARAIAGNAPADCLAFLAARLPVDRVIPAFARALEETGQAEQVAELRKGLNDFKSVGIDVEELFAKALTGEAAIYATAAPDSAVPDLVAVLGTARDRREALLACLQAVAYIAVEQRATRESVKFAPDGQRVVDAAKVRQFVEKHKPTVTEYAGGTLLCIPAEGQKPWPPTPAAVILQDRLIIGSTAAAAKRAAKRLGTGNSLAGNKAFNESLSRLPGEAAVVQYFDTAPVFTGGYALAAAFLGTQPGLLERWGLNAALLPPAQTVATHLRPEITALQAGAGGLLSLESRGNMPRAAIMAAAAAMFGKRAQQTEENAGGGRHAAEPVEEF
jgi:ferric-dicitrate binding protein FerR (iron transport regulator)